MSNILDNLNERQLQAVTETVNQSALVIAGAGSGKTSVLTRRIAYLKEQGVDLGNVLAVTFTNKAANEMLERIAGYIGHEEAKKISLGTFHRVCVRMLKRYGERIGVPRSFSIADPSDQQQVMRAALTQFYIETSALNARIFLGKISDLKNGLLTPKKFFDKMMGTSPQQPSDELLFKIYEEYQKRMDKLNMLDFDDLIMKTVQLLERSEETRRYLQTRFKYIMVDEYQDTNPAQYRFIQLLAAKALPLIATPNNTFVVGDDSQAIYGFRGSDLDIILGFQKDFPEARVIKLEENYRSTKTIVHAGNELIKKNKYRMDKTLFTSKAVGNKIKVYSALKGDYEADFVAKEILKLIKQGYKPEQMAILYRTNFISRGFETSLINARIPYTIVGGVGFYERAEIKDTVAYLKVIANPQDDIAMKRVLDVSTGIGKTTIEGIAMLAEQSGISMSEAFKYYRSPRAKTQDAIEVLRETLKELYLIGRVNQAHATPDPVSKMMQTVWKRTAFREKLMDKKDKDSISRLENLKELEHIVERYEKETPAPALQDFLDGVTLQSKSEEKQSSNAVSMMSMHASKGLEFPIVFVVAMEEGIFPHKNAMPEGEEEERRLAYVAVTRAQELLYLTHASQRVSYNGQEWNMPSRFIQELPPECIQRI